MGRSTLQTLPPTRPGCSRLPDARHRRRPGGVGAEPPTCFRDSEHTGPCRTRGRGAEPPGAQRQPNLQYPPTGYALLLNPCQICHISTPVMPLLPSTLPNLPTHPAGLELLLNVSQLNLPNPHTRHVLLTKQPMYARRLCAPAQRPANSANSANSARRPGRCSSLSLLLFFVEGANMAGAPVPQGIAC
jgi:hypothetical protein